jgi:hypothetical protein
MGRVAGQAERGESLEVETEALLLSGLELSKSEMTVAEAGTTGDGVGSDEGGEVPRVAVVDWE